MRVGIGDARACRKSSLAGCGFDSHPGSSVPLQSGECRVKTSKSKKSTSKRAQSTTPGRIVYHRTLRPNQRRLTRADLGGNLGTCHVYEGLKIHAHNRPNLYEPQPILTLNCGSFQNLTPSQQNALHEAVSEWMWYLIIKNPPKGTNLRLHLPTSSQDLRSVRPKDQAYHGVPARTLARSGSIPGPSTTSPGRSKSTSTSARATLSASRPSAPRSAARRSSSRTSEATSSSPSTRGKSTLTRSVSVSRRTKKIR